MTSPRRVFLAVLLCAAIVPSARAQICGDCDDNGAVNMLDALAGAQHSVALITLGWQGFTNCDVDSSSTVNVLDVVTIAHVVAGLPWSFGCSPAPTFTITQVEFDWRSGTADGHGLRVDAGTDVLVPEWRASPPRNQPAMFVGGQQPTIRFRATATPLTVTSATFRVATGTALGDFAEIIVPFTAGVSGDVELTLAGPVPIALEKYGVTLDWNVGDINGIVVPEHVAATTGPHTIYTVPAEPTTPWTASGVNEPWTRVLDYVTSWAPGATTPDDALTQMTPLFRDNYGMMYDTMWGAPGYSAGGWNLNLTLMLNRMDTATMGIFCCYDPARALAVFGNIVGGTYRFWFLDGPSGFFVNCIDLNGRTWSNSPFYDNDGSPPIRPPDMGPPRWAFGNHAFTGLNTATPPTHVWDGTFAGDGDVNPDEPPHIRTDMVNMPYALYSAITIDDNPFRTVFNPYVITFSIQ